MLIGLYLVFFFSFFVYTYFWRAKSLLAICRPFCVYGRCLDLNPESCSSKQACYQLSHPSPLCSPLDSSVCDLSSAAVTQCPLAGRSLQNVRQFHGEINKRTVSPFSETPAASKSSFIFGPLYSTKLVMVDINKPLLRRGHHCMLRE